MTLLERIRYRLGVLGFALKAATNDLHRGFTMRPIAGADGTDESDESEESGNGSAGGKESGDEESSTTKKGDNAQGEAAGKAEGEDGTEVFDADTAKAALKKKNSEAANLRKRLKELEPLAKRAKEIEDEQKSESQRQTEARTAAEKEAVTAGQEASRLRVALKKGLTEVQAKRLIGESEEELETDADELLESFKPKDDDKSDEESQEGKQSETPKGGERTGATGDTDGEETDPRKLAKGLPSYS